MAEDSEGERDRRIFRELYSAYPEHVEAAIFPTLFPQGHGVYDQDRPRPVRFVEYRDYLIQTHENFRNHVEWREWADRVAEAIEARRRGENIVFAPPSPEEEQVHMRQRVALQTVEERTVNPLKIREALRYSMQNNPGFSGLNAAGLNAALEDALGKARISGCIVEECATCRKYQCPEEIDLKLRKCSRCLSVYYCGSEHQVQDWPRHKRECKKLRQQREASNP